MGLGQVLFHGSLPYVFSCAMAVIVFSLVYRVFVLDEKSTLGILLIILLGSLASLHPIFLLIMGPVALAIVLVGGIPAIRKLLYASLILIGLLGINGIWLYELMIFDGGQVISKRFDSVSLSLLDWFSELEQGFFGFQVALVIAAIIGLVRLMRDTDDVWKRRLGGLLVFAIIFYALLSSVGWFVIAGLQPERFVVPLSLFLSFALAPSWPVIKSLWAQMEKVGTVKCLAFNGTLLSLALFACVPYSMYVVGFPTATPISQEFVTWIRENTDEKGRVFFYIPDRGGHYTPLSSQLPFYQMKTDRSLMGVPASNMYMSIRWIQDIGECLKRPKNASTCRDLYNIHYAITFSESINGSVSVPQEHVLDDFTLLKRIGGIQIHKSTVQSGSYFLLGNGEVKQSLNRIAVSVEPSEVVVLKFFWVPGLRTDPPLLIEPYPLPNGRAFIKVRSNFYRKFDIVFGTSNPGFSPLREIYSSLRTAARRQ
jgi:hypothetical protein